MKMFTLSALCMYLTVVKVALHSLSVLVNALRIQHQCF